MFLVCFVGLSHLGARKIDPFELMFLQQNRNSRFKELYSSEQVVYVKQLIDDLVDVQPSLCHLPIILFTTHQKKHLVYQLFHEGAKMIDFGLLTVKVDGGECHLKEVEPKGLHEKEDSEEGREDSAHIGEHINQGQISSVDGLGYGRALNPEICSDISSRICNISSRLERLGTKAGFPEVVCDGGDAFISVKDIFIEVRCVIVPNVVSQFHVISLQEVLEGIGIMRIHDCTELINSQGTTVVDSTGLCAIGLNQKSLVCIAHIPRAPNLISLVQRKAKPVAHAQSTKLRVYIWDSREMICSAIFKKNRRRCH